MRIKYAWYICSLSILFITGSWNQAKTNADVLLKQFVESYTKLDIPDFDYDFHGYFNSIPNEKNLEHQRAFFTHQLNTFKGLNRNKLKPQQQSGLDHVLYECEFNLKRILLEQKWVKNGRKVPEFSIHELADFEDWYSFFIQRYTSTRYSPQEIYNLGLSEVKRVQKEIKNIQVKIGMPDSTAFYSYLKQDHFYLTDKTRLIAGFEKIDSIARILLPKLFGIAKVPPVYAMEWPDANAFTPPGMYLNHSTNPYGKDVFQFNFYDNRYNKRAMEWLYMHEAVPGHHLQFSLRNADAYGLQNITLYPGNFEGWACYVEYFGKELGLYGDVYAELGKWEWDLVRSARLVLDAGIHYYGWTKEQALAYWKKTIPGQDNIAEREVSRVMNWCGQTLSYKIGASELFRLKASWKKKYPTKEDKEFHLFFLKAGTIPFDVLENQLLNS